MITNGGKEVISKYMLGQTNAYATHLSIGCGARPYSFSEGGPTLSELLEKEYMDFEMIRVPISSKGFVDNSRNYAINTFAISSNVATVSTTIVNDIRIGEVVTISGATASLNGSHMVIDVIPASNSIVLDVLGADTSGTGGNLLVGRTSLSLTAEIPTDNRYEITEVGIWSGPNNSLAGLSDSRFIFNFAGNWVEHSSSITQPPVLENFGSGADFDQTIVTQKIFYMNSSNTVFANVLRKQRKEGPRFLNRGLLIRGDTSVITGPAGSWIASGIQNNEVPTHIHLDNINFDISRNSPSDRLNLGFSLVDKNSTGNDLPNNVKILFEFFTNETNTGSNFAKIEAYIDGQKFVNNRHQNINIPISQGINEVSKITADVLTASGDGTTVTYTTDGAHNFEEGQSVTVENMIPTEYNVTNAEITSVGVSTFSIARDTTTSVTQGGNSFSYPNFRFLTDGQFSSPDIRVCRVFVSVENNLGEPSLDHYICFDGLRLENVSTENPLYKMTGYSVVNNENGFPIVKSSNNNGYVEFRFDLGVS
jgi:hypothetical protein